MASVQRSARRQFGRAIRKACLRFLVRLTIWIVGLTLTSFTLASSHATTFGNALANRQARDDAIRSIPLQELTPEVQNRIANVVSNPSVYRRLPVEIIDCDPEFYLFLVRHPEVVVNIWDLMGVTKMELQRKDDFTFGASDGMGTTSQMELVYGNHDTHVFYGEGVHRGKLLGKRVAGRCVLLLKSGYVSTAEGRVHITNQLDVFLQLDRVAISALAKTVHPFFGRTADSNFIQTVRFIERMSLTSERNAAGMQRLGSRLTKIDDPVRQQFLEAAVQVAERSRQRIATNTTGTLLTQ